MTQALTTTNWCPFCFTRPLSSKRVSCGAKECQRALANRYQKNLRVRLTLQRGMTPETYHRYKRGELPIIKLCIRCGAKVPTGINIAGRELCASCTHRRIPQPILPRKTSIQVFYSGKCLRCGESFLSAYPSTKYCSNKHKMRDKQKRYLKRRPDIKRRNQLTARRFGRDFKPSEMKLLPQEVQELALLRRQLNQEIWKSQQRH